MKNKTIIIVFIVILTIGVILFLINEKRKLDNTQTPNPVVTTPLVVPMVEIETEVQTQVVPVAPAEEQINPLLPSAGYKPE